METKRRNSNSSIGQATDLLAVPGPSQDQDEVDFWDKISQFSIRMKKDGRYYLQVRACWKCEQTCLQGSSLYLHDWTAVRSVQVPCSFLASVRSVHVPCSFPGQCQQCACALQFSWPVSGVCRCPAVSWPVSGVCRCPAVFLASVRSVQVPCSFPGWCQECACALQFPGQCQECACALQFSWPVLGAVQKMAY